MPEWRISIINEIMEDWEEAKSPERMMGAPRHQATHAPPFGTRIEGIAVVWEMHFTCSADGAMVPALWCLRYGGRVLLRLGSFSFLGGGGGGENDLIERGEK